MKSKIILVYYVVLVIIEIVAEVLFSYSDNANLMFVTKPLLMPTLIVWAFLFCKEHHQNLNKILVFALIFSMFGDISLMFVPFKPNIFIVGLINFLIAHIIYITLFLKHPFKNNTSIIKRKPLIFIACILFGISLIGFLYHQGQVEFLKMQYPVMVYATVILMMLLSAVSIYQANNKGLSLIVIGALLFVLSDTTIALNKFSLLFAEKEIYARILIMSLYTLAQFLIVKGYIMSTINHNNINEKANEFKS